VCTQTERAETVEGGVKRSQNNKHPTLVPGIKTMESKVEKFSFFYSACLRYEREERLHEKLHNVIVRTEEFIYFPRSKVKRSGKFSLRLIQSGLMQLSIECA
jgi:hypothetical protein